MILREAKWLDRICVHDYTFLGVPVDSIEVVETGMVATYLFLVLG